MKKSSRFTIAVVGGGAGGLYAASHAALATRQRGIEPSIHIFEKNPSVGKKLAITGSSQCNLTHDSDVREMAEHYYEHTREMLSILSRHTPEDTIRFFREHGLSLITRDDGKVFPSSFDAREVVETLKSICLENNVAIHTSSQVTAIRHEDGEFLLSFQEGTFSARSLIIATGGFTYQNTGSTGDGYTFARSLSHSVITPRLSLCPVKVTSTFSPDLSGITLEETQVNIGGKVRGTGSLLFTHTGLSGPAILHSSRYMKRQDTIRVSYVPMSESQMVNWIREKCGNEGKKQLITILQETGLPRRLLAYALSSCHVDETRKGAEVGKKIMTEIARQLSSMPFDISLKGMNSRAMVSAGGVDLTEIDLKTMESRFVPRLYFCGEVLDLDGETGGYNLQAAWSTAAIAGDHCINSTYTP